MLQRGAVRPLARRHGVLLRQPAPAASHRSGATDADGARAPWYPCACCPPNLMRTLSVVGAVPRHDRRRRDPAPPVRARRPSRRRPPPGPSACPSRPAIRGTAGSRSASSRRPRAVDAVAAHPARLGRGASLGENGVGRRDGCPGGWPTRRGVAGGRRGRPGPRPGHDGHAIGSAGRRDPRLRRRSSAVRWSTASRRPTCPTAPSWRTSRWTRPSAPRRWTASRPGARDRRAVDAGGRPPTGRHRPPTRSSCGRSPTSPGPTGPVEAMRVWIPTTSRLTAEARGPDGQSRGGAVDSRTTSDGSNTIFVGGRSAAPGSRASLDGRADGLADHLGDRHPERGQGRDRVRGDEDVVEADDRQPLRDGGADACAPRGARRWRRGRSRCTRRSAARAGRTARAGPPRRRPGCSRRAGGSPPGRRRTARP